MIPNSYIMKQSLRVAILYLNTPETFRMAINRGASVIGIEHPFVICDRHKLVYTGLHWPTLVSQGNNSQVFSTIPRKLFNRQYPISIIQPTISIIHFGQYRGLVWVFKSLCRFWRVRAKLDIRFSRNHVPRFLSVTFFFIKSDICEKSVTIILRKSSEFICNIVTQDYFKNQIRLRSRNAMREVVTDSFANKIRPICR